MSRSIDSGFHEQYMFRRPAWWPQIPSNIFRHSAKRRKTLGDWQPAPPRWEALLYALEKRKLLNVWIYRRHVEALLRPIAITSKDAFQTTWRERSELHQAGILKWTDGVVRFVGEVRGTPLLDSQSLLELDSGATKAEAQEFFTLLQFGFGAYGGKLNTWPIPGLNHRYAIVDVTSRPEFDRFVSQSNDKRREERRAHNTAPAPGAKKPPMYDVRSRYGPAPWPVLPYDGVAQILAQPIPAEDRASALSVRNAKIDALQEKLNQLVASLKTGSKSGV